MERLYQERDLCIELKGATDCRYRGETEDLEEMLGNLLDNACKWARHRIGVQCECTDQGLAIQIEDDGPGIPEQRMAEVLERGKRLDETPFLRWYRRPAQISTLAQHLPPPDWLRPRSLLPTLGQPRQGVWCSFRSPPKVGGAQRIPQIHRGAASVQS